MADTPAPCGGTYCNGTGGITLYATPDWIPHTKAELSAYPGAPATATGSGTSTGTHTGTSTGTHTGTSTGTHTGTGAGAGVVTLNWTPAQYATTYNLYYATTPANATEVPSTTATTTKMAGLTVTSATVGGLTAGTKYYFVVSPQNPGYEGPESDVVSATP